MFNSTDVGFPWNDFRNFFNERSQMVKVKNGVETVPKISMAWVGRTNVSDRLTTSNGRGLMFANKNAIDTWDEEKWENNFAVYQRT